jgi:RNA polymerase sigma-70 factor (ECF subfamily)
MFTHDEGNPAAAIRVSVFALPSVGAESSPVHRLISKDAAVPATPDLRALTLAVRRGDAAAFAQFYDLYSFRLYKYLLVLARGDENEAREVLQTVLIKLAKRLAVMDEDQELWAWLCALAKNTFIDHCRARQRRNRLVSGEEQPLEVAHDASSTAQLSELLQDALASLSSEERELVQAAYVDGRPLQELADASGQSYKAMESRLARLRLKLRAQLLRNLRHENES